MTINLTQTQMLVGLGLMLAFLLVWRTGARRARAVADAARAGTRLVSLTGRVLFMAVLMVGVQWVVIRHASNVTLLLVVLALPDLIAAYVLTRALTVSAMDGAIGRWSDRR
jgi:hypothetical protein